MSQRFHFDLTNGEETIRDAEGVESSGPDEAIEEAQAVLDEMCSGEGAEMRGAGWQLVIRDKDGATLKTLPLR